MTQRQNTGFGAARNMPKDALDDFPTPPWATRALFAHLMPIINKNPYRSAQRPLKTPMIAWEPACGAGHMAKTLKEYYETVYASDIHPYGYGKVGDALTYTPPDLVSLAPPACDIITNPPFKLADEIIHRMLNLIQDGCVLAIFQRVAFLEGIDRYMTLWQPRPPQLIGFFSERVALVKGKLDRKASTTAFYAWFIWVKHPQPNKPAQPIMQTKIIPPCRKKLERPEDWDEDISSNANPLPLMRLIEEK